MPKCRHFIFRDPCFFLVTSFASLLVTNYFINNKQTGDSSSSKPLQTQRCFNSNTERITAKEKLEKRARLPADDVKAACMHF